ncbi:MAG: DUF5331 domain-containing protein [Kaiparowitsia implicata GSE-PSE-MK54-09C]|nr:DUF5331 domain-containing protein [Kaiparowitsia implicata GSE-PSE-MK54-09C]
MNIQYLRQSLKARWLNYYRDNRPWLTKLAVWVDCDGQRRPSSGFIIGTLTTLEPQLMQLLPLVVDLSNNPDRIVVALGLNFNPDDELKAVEEAEEKEAMKMLPGGDPPVKDVPATHRTKLPSLIDEDCTGAGQARVQRKLPRDVEKG